MPRSIRSVLDWLKSLWAKPMKEDEMSGDIIVCGVGADEIIDDIGVSAPKGEAVRVPGDKAYRSKDVWRLLSQGRLIQLNVNPLIRARAITAPTAQPQVVDEGLEVLQSEYNKATVEITRLRTELTQARSETISLRSELVAAQAEIERLKGAESHAAKLDDILNLLKERPVVVNNVVASAAPQTSVVEDDIPMYIPSQIKSEAAESRVAVKEESAPASALSDASKALREKRKKQ